VVDRNADMGQTPNHLLELCQQEAFAGSRTTRKWLIAAPAVRERLASKATTVQESGFLRGRPKAACLGPPSLSTLTRLADGLGPKRIGPTPASAISP